MEQVLLSDHEPDASGVSHAELRQALGVVVAESLQPVALGVAALYGLLTVSHQLILPPPARAVMVPLAAGTAVVLLGLGLLVRRRVRAALAHPVAAAIVALALLNCLAHLAVQPATHLSFNVSLVIIAAGVFYLSLPWFVGTTLVALSGWVLVVAQHPPAEQWTPSLFHLISALTIASLAQTVRIRAYHRLERHRLLAERRGDALVQRNRELHQATELARELARTAEEASRAKSDFLARATHELRTPMSGLIGLIEYLLETDLAPNQRDLADIVRASGQSLLGALNDLLDLSRIEAGGLTLDHTKFDLPALVEDALDMVAPRAEARSLELVSSIADNVPRRALGDPLRLRQVLANLLNNATRFTEQGEVVVSAEVISSEPGRVVLECQVRDTGIGITPEAQARLFRSYEQAEASTARRYGGSGLGLVIARQLVELMGGELGVESAPGSGSTFWFRLPLEPARQATVLPPAMAGRALVVEDHPATAASLAQQLGRAGLSVDWAASAAEARQFTTAAEYDWLLVDVSLPNGDAEELLDALAAKLTSRCRPVLMGNVAERPARRPVGRARWLLKPIRESRVRQLLQTPADETQLPALPLASPRLLVAEDNTVNQMLARLVLENLGCRVEVVNNGREAVAAASERDYDAVLMDCEMPGLDGYEATRAIRTGPRPSVPIIATTAHQEEEEWSRCLAAGMDDRLAKPLTAEAAWAALERCLRPRESTVLDAEIVADLRQIAANTPGFLPDLVRTFSRSLSEQMDLIEAALAKADAEALWQAAHRLKGTTASMGAAHLGDLGLTLEKLGRAGQTEGGTRLLEQIRTEAGRVRSALWALAGETDAHSDS
ncbi:MAG: response regulator [Armatimonadetes bacterium]|nr:response regulator [Armatimonadota bacterium]